MVHETAHQWFGDSATTADWNHNWLSEGFATYFTQLYNDFNFGRDRFVQGMRGSRDRVIGFWRQTPDQPLVDNRLNVREAHNSNNYQKGAWLLHMVRRELGDEGFWAGIREYYRQYSAANALTEDFQRVMEETSGKDLEELFHQWVYVPGQPKFEGEWYYDAAKKELVVRLDQTQPVDHTFRVLLDIGIVEAQVPRRTETVQISERSHTIRFPVDSEPISVVLDPDVWLLMEEEFGRR